MTNRYECGNCGKPLSPNQAVTWYRASSQMVRCLDCVFWSELRPDEDTRINISVDLLMRLRDGLLYAEDYVDRSNTQNDLKTYRSPFARRR